MDSNSLPGNGPAWRDHSWRVPDPGLTERQPQQQHGQGILHRAVQG